MGNDQSIPIKQSVLKLTCIEHSLTFSQVVVLETQFFIYECRDKEIGNDVVAFGCLVAQPDVLGIILLFLRFIARKEKVKVPLNHISGIGVLFIYRFVTHSRTNLIVFAVTYIIYLLLHLLLHGTGVHQVGKGVHVVHPFTVFLFLKSRWNVLAPHQFVDDGLKDDIEVLRQQVFFLIVTHIDGVRLVEKSIAEFP